MRISRKTFWCFVAGSGTKSFENKFKSSAFKSKLQLAYQKGKPLLIIMLSENLLRMFYEILFGKIFNLFTGTPNYSNHSSIDKTGIPSEVKKMCFPNRFYESAFCCLFSFPFLQNKHCSNICIWTASYYWVSFNVVAECVFSMAIHVIVKKLICDQVWIDDNLEKCCETLCFLYVYIHVNYHWIKYVWFQFN